MAVDANTLFDPPAAAVADDPVHIVTELNQVNDRPVVTTTCGRTGPPRMPSAPTGLRTTAWAGFATCAACLSP